MIRALTAYTGEIDDVEAAVAEIQKQLDAGGGLLKNTVGILTCYADFVASGAVKELCASLPFDVVGATTLGNATSRSIDEPMLLTLMVLTSDDVAFSVGLSAPILSEDIGLLREAYESATATATEKPALMLSFAPLLLNVGGDFYVNSYTEISGGVPNFGMISVDHNDDYHEAYVLHNGEAYFDRYAFILLFGNVAPRFFVGSISSERLMLKKGVVTASRGNQLQTVNDRPVVEYLESLGLTRGPDGTINGINSFPFIVDYNDGTEPVVRVIFANTPEGYAVCGGNIPVGAILSVGSIDAADIVVTSSKTLRAALASGRSDCLLMFSCIARYFTLGLEPASEIEKLQEILKETNIPWQFAYSGGELCPVYALDGASSINRCHNETFVTCVL
ncbi:MAG: FIST C-terminal domain-containing protein [Synergistaceae bacterium]|jgi:hypothetical protein|nr:FIST C-terminal domain-containing protein [Synergistaceae bacterium]